MTRYEFSNQVRWQLGDAAKKPIDRLGEAGVFMPNWTLIVTQNLIDQFWMLYNLCRQNPVLATHSDYKTIETALSKVQLFWKACGGIPYTDTDYLTELVTRVANDWIAESFIADKERVWDPNAHGILYEDLVQEK